MVLFSPFYLPKIPYFFIPTVGVTKPDESLFVYQQGQDHSTFHHPSYQPIFPDSQSLDFTNKTLEKEAQNICGDSSECMFDIFTTGKVRIGRATKETVTQFVAVINDTVKPGERYSYFYTIIPSI